MKIFISWSGDPSRQYADLLKTYLPCMMPGLSAYMSKCDVTSGTRWQAELASELEQSGFGIVCLTPNNLDSRWILFEAGAITKHTAGRACSLLFGGLRASDVTGPLSQFQNRLFVKDEFKQLVRDINTNLEHPLSSEQLQMIFDTWWDRIEKNYAELNIGSDLSRPSPPRRDVQDLVEEVLVKIRNIEMAISDALTSNKASEGASLKNIGPDDLRNIKSNVADIADSLSHRDKFDEAAIALAPDSVPSDWARGIEAMKSVLRDEPHNRRAAIWLGRIYRKMSEQGVERRQYINEAIGTLMRFLEAKGRRAQEDEDAADALYNLACYKIRKGDYIAGGSFLEEVGNPADIRDALYRDGINDLERSIELKPVNATDAATDRDFDRVRGCPAFQELMERANPGMGLGNAQAPEASQLT